MPDGQRGKAWFVDLRIVAKVRFRVDAAEKPVGPADLTRKGGAGFGKTEATF